MKYLYGARHFLMAFCMLAITSHLLLPFSAAAQAGKGQLTFSRQVTINGTEATAGQTIFNGSRIQVGPGGTAVLNLGPLGRIDLGGGAEFTLRLSETTVGGDLMIGCMSISAPGGVGVVVNSNQGAITSDGSLPTAFWLGYKDGGARVIPTMGEIRTTAGNQTESAKVGDLVTLSTNAAGERSLQRRPAAECGATPGAMCACASAAIPRTSTPAPGAPRTATTQAGGNIYLPMLFMGALVSSAAVFFAMQNGGNPVIGGDSLTCVDRVGIICRRVSTTQP